MRGGLPGQHQHPRLHPEDRPARTSAAPTTSSPPPTCCRRCAAASARRNRSARACARSARRWSRSRSAGSNAGSATWRSPKAGRNIPHIEPIAFRIGIVGSGPAGHGVRGRHGQGRLRRHGLRGVPRARRRAALRHSRFPAAERGRRRGDRQPREARRQVRVQHARRTALHDRADARRDGLRRRLHRHRRRLSRDARHPGRLAERRALRQRAAHALQSDARARFPDLRHAAAARPARGRRRRRQHGDGRDARVPAARRRAGVVHLPAQQDRVPGARRGSAPRRTRRRASSTGSRIPSRSSTTARAACGACDACAWSSANRTRRAAGGRCRRRQRARHRHRPGRLRDRHERQSDHGSDVDAHAQRARLHRDRRRPRDVDRRRLRRRRHRHRRGDGDRGDGRRPQGRAQHEGATSGIRDADAPYRPARPDGAGRSSASTRGNATSCGCADEVHPCTRSRRLPSRRLASADRRQSRRSTQHVVEIISDSGEGAQRCGQALGAIAARMGLGVWTVEIIPGRDPAAGAQRRRRAAATASASGRSRVTNGGDETDLVVAFNEQVLLGRVRAGELKPGCTILLESMWRDHADPAIAGLLRETYDQLRRRRLSRSTRSRWSASAAQLVSDARRGKNMFALGMLCNLYSLDLQLAREQIALTFGKKAAAVVETNVQLLEAGHAWADANLDFKYRIPGVAATEPADCRQRQHGAGAGRPGVRHGHLRDVSDHAGDIGVALSAARSSRRSAASCIRPRTRSPRARLRSARRMPASAR